MANRPQEETTSERIGKLGGAYREALIKSMAEAYGERPANAERIDHERELMMWMMPTSPAALEAFKRGGTLQDAEEANRLWAQAKKAEQQAALQQGATPEQLKEAGLTDDAIFGASRKYAVARAKAHGKGDPKLEVEWHEAQAKKAAEWRAKQQQPTQPTITSQPGVSSDAEVH
jgi:hypothetical protein